MWDLSSLGKDGFIVQYEDIVSMIGFNVARYFRSKGISTKLDNMSIRDVLSSYIDRTDEDYSIWLKQEFGIDINPDDYLSSFLTMQPNLLYSYKVFTTAHREHADNLIIYSNKYSPIAEQSTKSYGFDGIEYRCDDLETLLNEHPNYTYLTSCVNNISICEKILSPIVLLVCDDYMYTSEIFTSKLDKRLKEKPNIILRFTSVISAGIIN